MNLAKFSPSFDLAFKKEKELKGRAGGNIIILM
jgi:hypothetical protein